MGLSRALKKFSNFKYRDIGEHIRQKIATSFPQGESSKINTEEWSKFVEHLENIANNKPLKTHQRQLKSTAVGLNLEQCKEIVSTDFLKFAQKGFKSE